MLTKHIVTHTYAVLYLKLDIPKKLPQHIKEEIIKRADNALKTKWGTLLAATQLQYLVDGDRYTYQGFLNDRRKKLMNLIVAQVLTGDKKYLNDIANGIWLIMEESSWIWPAHLYLQKAGLGLPDPRQTVIDLGAGQTSAYIAWAQLFVGKQLAKVSPIISQRIEFELNRRIVRPYLDDQHMPWMGFDGYEFCRWNVGNNWNAWINSNIIMTSFLSLNEPSRNDIIKRSVLSADIFTNRYPNDGGDNEGPHYWAAAGGRLIQFLSLMSSVSGNQINWSSNQLLKRTGEYIYRVHIDKDHFFNYGDTPAREIYDPSLVLQYGLIFNDNLMKQFASYLNHLRGSEGTISSRLQSGELNQIFIQLSANTKFAEITPKAPQPMESWFPDLQVITLRTKEGSAEGIFLGAKAGSNYDTQHNHNDVGSFVLYVNGLPALIDIGVGTYTIDTFSDHRYNIWNFQSQWHNTPTINGIQQQCGPQFKAQYAKYTKLENGGEFETDIAGAYPPEAQVKSWIRKWTFNRNTNTVVLTEKYVLILENKSTKLYMSYDSIQNDVEVDRHDTQDPSISGIWGQYINRVSLVTKSEALEGEFVVKFHL
ncbi:unnamed protein product [Medioppia subpectinata]|uniref:Heparinase II/III-like C-terminal domain-containing protein n=1 Tax=Medioppia subpectinata TaxID=1979941 RepID=A0A7R9PXT8_9ACAR|nr:unnamed protein product [Medioppia subpectinata]CAG2104372.1 unnamed protein product [Medioppia subpectinata]